LCKLANDDSGILGVLLLSKQASEAALYAGGVVHLPELPAVPPAELSKFRYHHGSDTTLREVEEHPLDGHCVPGAAARRDANARAPLGSTFSQWTLV
jgi:hypothetical protein